MNDDMNELDRINAVLTEMGKRDGIANFRLSADGTCGLDLADDTKLHFEWLQEAEKLFVCTPLSELPEDLYSRLAVCETIASMNCLSPRLGTIVAHLDSSQVLYQVGIYTGDLDADRLYDTLEVLLEERPFVAANIEAVITQTSEDDVITGPDRNAGTVVEKKRDQAVENNTASSNAPHNPSHFATRVAENRNKSWIDELREIANEGIRFRYHPCSEKDIGTVEAKCKHQLPAEYRRFLEHTGHGSDLLFAGEDVFFPDLLTFQERANDILVADGSRCVLPKTAFVFFIHQNIQFFFFHLNAGGDPPIYSYEEGAMEFTKVYTSFSEFMQIYVALHAENYETLKKGSGAGTLP